MEAGLKLFPPFKGYGVKLMQLKAAKDERVEIVPDQDEKDLGKLEESK